MFVAQSNLAVHSCSFSWATRDLNTRTR